MSSFGFTEKGSGKASQQAIGVYGNGFKSGSMRLGRDALIFTKNGGCQTVGMLSQTYLENIKAQAVIVPIVPFNQQTNILHDTVGHGHGTVFTAKKFKVTVWLTELKVVKTVNEYLMQVNGHNSLFTLIGREYVTLQAPPCPDLNSVLRSLVVTEDSEASLAAILQNSIITSQEQIHAHFDSILSKKGTKILIWNIRR